MLEVARSDELKDFFVSYNSADRLWAEWIAWQLEEEGYSVVLQAPDIRPGENWAQKIGEVIGSSRHIIIVLSPDYLGELSKHLSWIRALRADPTEDQENLILVHVRESPNQPEEVLSLLAKVDLVGRDEDKARELLLDRVRRLHSKAPLHANSLSKVEHTIEPEQPRFPANMPRIWNVPDRNPFFTDREELLHYLRDAFVLSNVQALTQPMALSGLGGIGKTQTAIEYAYRYRGEYQAVLWAPAETRDTLTASCLDIARLLNLPQKDEEDHDEIITAVKGWLQDRVGWLLIFDNADDPSIVRDFLPTIQSGHVLITTRARALGRIAKSLVVETWTPEKGALFLLRRIGVLESESLLNIDNPLRPDALSLVYEMDGLPLALDQAGAYIEEIGCSIANYLALYRQRRHELLSRRGAPPFDHPQPVATTWTISFGKVQDNNPAAAALLRLFAFLAADEIPEELITRSLADVSFEFADFRNNPLVANDAIAELRKYSLVLRDPGHKTLSVHRLVQAMLRDTMSEQEQRSWAEQAIRAVSHIFPAVKFETWEQCQRYLPHALACAAHIEQWNLLSSEAAQLLHRAGSYLSERARYDDAEALLRRAVDIYEKIIEADREDFAQTLNDLAKLSMDQSKYEEAEQLYQRALSIIEQFLGSEHNSIIEPLHNLSTLYYIQGKYTETAPIAKRVLDISEKNLGPDHPFTAASLNNLGTLYEEQGKYEQAEPLLQRALIIHEQQLGARYPNTASILSNLASLYRDQGKYEQAEPLYQRALTLREELLGTEHPDTAHSLNSLASLYREQGKYEQAEPLYQRALAIREQVLGSDHPATAVSLSNLGSLYRKQGKYEQAEPLLQRALAIREQVFGTEHPNTATILNNLGWLYRVQRKYELAEPLFQRALSIREQALGSDHPDTATSLNSLGSLYGLQGKYEQAESHYQRALAIREQVLGPDHPDTATTLSDLGSLYRDQKKYELAESLYQRALAIREQALGPDHPDTATTLNSLGSLYLLQEKYELAEPLYQRALAIREKVLGPKHPDTAASLNNLGRLYTLQENFTRAEPLCLRALSIRRQVSGSQHPDTQETQRNLIFLWTLQLMRMIQPDKATAQEKHVLEIVESIKQGQLSLQTQFTALEKYMRELRRKRDKQVQSSYGNKSAK